MEEDLNIQVSSVSKNRVKVVFFVLTGIILLAGTFYLGMKTVSKKEIPTRPQETSYPTGTPVSTPVSEKVVDLNVNPKTSVISPDKYGFTKTIELKGIGVKAKFPQNIGNVSLQEKDIYVIKSSDNDQVAFSLRNYDGGGRRAWFQKEYPWTKGDEYTMESFVGVNHSGYFAYTNKLENRPGMFFYFTAISSNKILVISAVNYINTSVFFGGDLEKFKSFLSTIELIFTQTVTLEPYPSVSDMFRWSETRKTVWEDVTLGLKITAPEWEESRYTRERDINGKNIYSDWTKSYPEAKTYDINYDSKYVKSVNVSAGFSYNYLNILSTKYVGKSFSDIANELLIPAGFCATEWKNSKSECTSSNYCYTKDEVLQNLTLKSQIKIGTLDAQLRSMNEEFSNLNDCRSEDTWLIIAKNGQFVSSSISPNGEIVRLEAL